MTKSKTKHKAFAFLGAAALITATFLALVLLFTACPNTAGGGSGGTGGSAGGGGSESGSALPAGFIPLAKLKIIGTVLKGYKGGKPAGILRVPKEVPAGKVTVIVRTKLTGSNKTLKEVREMIFKLTCTAKT